MSLRTPNEPTDNFRLPTKAPAAAPQPKPDAWRKTETPGIEVNQEGMRRTDLPLPKLAATFIVDTEDSDE